MATLPAPQPTALPVCGSLSALCPCACWQVSPVASSVHPRNAMKLIFSCRLGISVLSSALSSSTQSQLLGLPGTFCMPASQPDSTRPASTGKTHAEKQCRRRSRFFGACSWSWSNTSPALVQILTAKHEDWYTGHYTDVDVVRWHPNGNFLGTGSTDRTVRLWDLREGQSRRILAGHKAPVRALPLCLDIRDVYRIRGFSGLAMAALIGQLAPG